MLNDIASIATIWLSIVSSTLALVACISLDKEGKFKTYVISLRSRIAYSLAVVIYFGFRFSDTVLGDRLLSVRSYVISIIVSFLFSVVAFWVAWITADELLTDMFNAFYIAVTTWPAAAIVWTALLVGLSIDYVSVLETRYLMRFIKLDSSFSYVALMLLVDLLSTNLVFLIGHTLASSLFSTIHYFLNVNIYTSYESGGLMHYRYMMEFFVGMFRNSFIHQLYNNTHIILEHYKHFFSVYTFSLFAMEYTDITTKARGSSIFFYYPLTTMYATAFVSSFWIYFCSMVLVLSRVFARSSSKALKAVMWIYDNPLVFSIYMFIGCIFLFCISIVLLLVYNNMMVFSETLI